MTLPLSENEIVCKMEKKKWSTEDKRNSRGLGGPSGPGGSGDGGGWYSYSLVLLDLVAGLCGARLNERRCRHDATRRSDSIMPLLLGNLLLGDHNNGTVATVTEMLLLCVIHPFLQVVIILYFCLVLMQWWYFIYFL